MAAKLRNRQEYWQARTARKQHECGGERAECADRIEPGARYVEMKLPPNSDMGNPDWWLMRVCVPCASGFNRELVVRLGLAEAVSPR